MGRKRLVMLLLLLLGVGLNLQFAQAQSGLVWTAYFFNNPFLADPVVVTRQDTVIAFNWGGGSPATGVNADNFSARWGTSAFFAAGTYRFYAQADDAVRVTLNDVQVLINTLDSPRPAQLLTADVTLNAGTYKVQVDFQEFGGDAYLYVSWADLATNPTGPNFAPSLGSGPWTAQYYGNPNLLGTPTLIQSENSPSHNWGSGSPVASIPADNFSARWTSAQTLTAGTYQIITKADDGVRVIVDGVVYINEFHGATGQTYIATIPVVAGQHSFVVEYNEGSGDAFLEFTISSLTPTPVPTNAVATITAARLNARDIPNPYTGKVVVKISKGENYSIVGRNANSTWWQLNINGILGWVNGRFITVTNAQNVPVTTTVTPNKPGTTTPPPVVTSCSGAPASRLVIGKLGRVTPGVSNNVRSAAGRSNALIGTIPSGGTFTVLSGPQCANTMAWWQVNYNGLVGWTAEGSGSDYWLEPIP